MTETPDTHATSVTDTGRVRDHNEDAATVFIPSDENQRQTRGLLAVVADGMGGFEAGERASAAALDTFSRSYYSSTETDPVRALMVAARDANTMVRQIPAKRCGTTFVAAAVIGSRVIVLNIGDSRAYMVTPQGTRQITRDHSWVAEQVHAGHMTETQAASHPRRNVLSRAFGSGEYPDVDIFEETLCENCAVVLCSDGLHNLVSADEIGSVVNESAPDRAAMQLVALANERGGHDNISVSIVRAGSLSGLQTGYSTIRRKHRKSGLPKRVLVLAALLAAVVVAAGLLVSYAQLDSGDSENGSSANASDTNEPATVIDEPAEAPAESVETTYSVDPDTAMAVSSDTNRFAMVDINGLHEANLRTGDLATQIAWNAREIRDADIDAQGNVWIIATELRIGNGAPLSGLIKLEEHDRTIVPRLAPDTNGQERTLAVVGDSVFFTTDEGVNQNRSLKIDSDMRSRGVLGTARILDAGLCSQANSIALMVGSSSPEDDPYMRFKSDLSDGTLSPDDSGGYYFLLDCEYIAAGPDWYAPFAREKNELRFYDAGKTKDFGYSDSDVIDARTDLAGKGSLIWITSTPEGRAALLYRHPTGGVAVKLHRIGG